MNVGGGHHGLSIHPSLQIIEADEPESPSPKTATLPKEAILAQLHALPDEQDEETVDIEVPVVDRIQPQFDDWPGSDDEGPSMSSSDTATDDDWAPAAPTKGKAKALVVVSASEEEEVIKVSRNAAAARTKGKTKKAPPPVLLYDVSMEEPVVQLKTSKSTKSLKWAPESSDAAPSAEDDELDVTGAAAVPKKKKR